MTGITDPEINVNHFEAVKISMNQNADGIVLKMAIHPDDCPPKLFNDFVGSRYMVAMARIMEDETPEQTPQDLKRIKDSCTALCRHPKFQKWILQGTGMELTEGNAAEVVRNTLGISSRADLDNSALARSAFVDMREDFYLWLKRQSL